MVIRAGLFVIIIVEVIIVDRETFECPKAFAAIVIEFLTEQNVV